MLYWTSQFLSTTLYRAVSNRKKEIRVLETLDIFFFVLFYSVYKKLKSPMSKCRWYTVVSSELFFVISISFIYVWHRPELHNSTRLHFATEIKPESCGHCTSFVHPSNYTAPGVIHGIKSARALEHWLRNVCKCIARSGSSTLWLRAHFSRLSFDIGKFSHYFSTSCCC